MSSIVTSRSVHENKGVIAFHLEGKLILDTLDEFKTLFAKEFDAGNYKLMLNFSQVNFMVSTHLGVIMGAYKKALENGGDIKFTELSQEVYKIFKALQLTSTLSIFDTDEDAMNNF